MKMSESSPKSRKYCVKGKNCLLGAVSSFPSVFKRLILQACKTRACLEKGQPISHTILTCNQSGKESFIEHL